MMMQQILSQLYTLPLASFRGKKKDLFNNYFTQAEIDHLKERALQTVLGFVALKKALIQLIQSAYPGVSLHEKDIRLGHSPEGAPLVVEIKGLWDRTKLPPVHLSISHTRDHVYGLAVMEGSES